VKQGEVKRKKWWGGGGGGGRKASVTQFEAFAAPPAQGKRDPRGEEVRFVKTKKARKEDKSIY